MSSYSNITTEEGLILDATTSDPGGGPDNPYVAGASGFNFTSVFNDPQSPVTCEYTIDGSSWSAGSITDKDFALGIEYLVSQGIIRV